MEENKTPVKKQGGIKVGRLVVLLVVVGLIVVVGLYVAKPMFDKIVVKERLDAQNEFLANMMIQIQQRGFTEIQTIDGPIYLIPAPRPQ